MTMIEATAHCPEERSRIVHAGEALDDLRSALRRGPGDQGKHALGISYSDVRDVGWNPPDERTRSFDMGRITIHFDTPVATIKVTEGGHYEIDTTAGPSQMTALPGGLGSRAWAYLHGDSTPDDIALWLRWAFLAADTTNGDLERKLWERNERVRVADTKATQARAERAVAIAEAISAGVSMYRIAQVTGVSQQAVAKIAGTTQPTTPRP